MSFRNPSKRLLHRSSLTLLLLIGATSITSAGCQNWWKPGKNKSLLGFVREQPEENPEVAPPVAAPGPAKRVVLPKDRAKQEQAPQSSNHLTRSELATLPTPKDIPPNASTKPDTLTNPISPNAINSSVRSNPVPQSLSSEKIAATEKTGNTEKSSLPENGTPKQNSSTTELPSNSGNATALATTQSAPDPTNAPTPNTTTPNTTTPNTTTPAHNNSSVDIEEALALLPPTYQSKMRQAIERQTPGLVSLENKSANETLAAPNTNLVEPASFRDQKDRAATSNDPNRWTEDLNRTIQSLEQRLAQTPTIDPTLRTHLEMNLRLLYLTQRDLEKAKRPIEGLSSREQSFLDHQLSAWFQTTSPDPNPNRPRHWSQVITEQQQANHHLAALGALQINCIEFCSQVDGYGAITKFPKKLFQPDQELLLYCELENVTAETVRNGFETRIKGTYELRDAQGKRILEQALPMAPDICEHQRRDHFLVYKIFMPASIPEGKYELQLTMEDLQGNKFAVSKTEFEIRK